MNMDMDVAWCLTCSKRTRDHRNPYCSDACRIADQGAASSAAALLTSPLPVGLISPQKSTDKGKESSPNGSPLTRPALRTLPTVVGTVSDPVHADVAHAIRDRRAFSFPDQQPADGLTFARRRARPSQVLTPSSKRSIIAALTPISQPQLADKKLLKLKNGSTGVSTPLCPESVFCSTSDSSDDECEHIEYKAVPRQSPLALPKVQSAASPRLAADQFSSLRSQLSSGRANSLHSREASHSPVIGIIASSASSRSREDIMSWARAVRARPENEKDEPDENRGRPRTRRSVGDGSQSVIESEDDVGSGLGTTPKGKIGGALAGIGMTPFGVGSIYKQLTAATTSPGRSNRDDELTSLPSAASVSRVAVFAHTNPSLPLEEAQSSFHGGTTPTLSTLSISEVHDLSVQGTHDIDVFTDDGGMSATSSNFVRRVSMAGKQPRKQSLPVQTDNVQPSRPLPRPIASTANAIWNVTSYLARFAPFGLPNVINSYAPFTKGSSNSTPATGSGTPVKSGNATPAKLVPLAVEIVQPRSRPDSPLTHAQELVRSLPMAIVPPQPSTDEDWERERQRQADQATRQRSSRSRARSKSRPVMDYTMGDRSNSRGRRSPSSSPSQHRGRRGRKGGILSPEPAIGSTNQDPDADADVSDDEGVTEQRGRRGRTASVRIGKMPRHPDEVGEGTETERGRGRSRSIRPGAR